MPASDSAESTNCPAWIDRYASWHSENRHAREAQFLVYTCRPSMPGTHSFCLGLGDRVRMIAFLLRVAAAYQRVLLVDWASPVPIERYLSPARIDWRLTPAEVEAMLPLKRIRGSTQTSTAPSLVCLWQALFVPSETIDAKIKQQQLLTIGSDVHTYNSIHIRMGDGAVGSAFDKNTVPVSDVRMSRAEAEKLLEYALRRSTTPLFLATDNAALKRDVQQHRWSKQLPLRTQRRVVTQGCADCMSNPVFRHNFSLDSLDSSWIDIGMLAGANCTFEKTRGRISQFTMIVRAWSHGKQCVIELPRPYE